MLITSTSSGLGIDCCSLAGAAGCAGHVSWSLSIIMVEREPEPL